MVNGRIILTLPMKFFKKNKSLSIGIFKPIGSAYVRSINKTNPSKPQAEDTAEHLYGFSLGIRLFCVMQNPFLGRSLEINGRQIFFGR